MIEKINRAELAAFPASLMTRRSILHAARLGAGAWALGSTLSACSPDDRPDTSQPTVRLRGTLTSAKAHPDTGYGRVTTEWQLDGEQATIHLLILPNTTATLRLPARSG